MVSPEFAVLEYAGGVNDLIEPVFCLLSSHHGRTAGAVGSPLPHRDRVWEQIQCYVLPGSSVLACARV